MADSLAEMDHKVGLIVDAIDEIGIAVDTMLIFGSANGPEFRDLGKALRDTGVAATTQQWKEACACRL